MRSRPDTPYRKALAFFPSEDFPYTVLQAFREEPISLNVFSTLGNVHGVYQENITSNPSFKILEFRLCKKRSNYFFRFAECFVSYIGRNGRKHQPSVIHPRVRMHGSLSIHTFARMMAGWYFRHTPWVDGIGFITTDALRKHPDHDWHRPPAVVLNNPATWSPDCGRVRANSPSHKYRCRDHHQKSV